MAAAKGVAARHSSSWKSHRNGTWSVSVHARELSTGRRGRWLAIRPSRFPKGHRRRRQRVISALGAGSIGPRIGGGGPSGFRRSPRNLGVEVLRRSGWKDRSQRDSRDGCQVRAFSRRSPAQSYLQVRRRRATSEKRRADPVSRIAAERASPAGPQGWCRRRESNPHGRTARGF